MEKAVEAIEKYQKKGYKFFGIRIDAEDKKPGMYFPKSYVWEDGFWTSEKLDGTCCVEMNIDDYVDFSGEIEDALDYAKKTYSGESGNAYIVAGEYEKNGEDYCEVIISNCVVCKDGKGRNYGGLCIYKFD
jgi:hypothetical protein